MSIPYRSESHRSITLQPRADIAIREVVSALDPLILTQDKDAPVSGVEMVDGGKGLYVFADVVRVRGPVVLPGRQVFISARVLQAEPDSKGRKATLDVSGAPGAAPADATAKPARKSAAASGHNEVAHIGNLWGQTTDKPGADGEKKAQGGAEGQPGHPGFNGGVIEIYCDRVDESLDLELVAVGGRGGNGQDGQPGQDGQDGGQGAEGTDPFGGFGLRHGTPGGNGGDGGDGARGGRGGYGGGGGNITLWTNVKAAPVRHRESAGAMGDPGKSGAGGAVGKGGKGGQDYTAGAWTEMPVPTPGTPKNGKDGKSGSTPSPTINGTNVTHEGFFQQNQVGYEDLSRRAKTAHLTMMMQRIRWAYLAAHPELNKDGFTEASLLLAWVLNMTKPFDKDWSKADKKSYPDQRPLRELNQLGAIHRQAGSLTGQLALGLSYYGQPESFAPRTSLSFYQTYLAELVKTAESLEETSRKYFSELGQTQAAQGTLRAAAGQTQSLMTSLNEDRKRLQSRLAELQGAIEAAHAEVLKQERVVAGKLALLEAEISRLNDLSATDLVKIIGSAVTPSSGKDQKSIGSVLLQVGGDVKDLYEKGEETQYKINRLDVLGQGAKSLKEAYGYSKGYITESDPHAYKLIASKTLLDKEMEKYYGVVQSDEVSAALRTLIDRVQERNEMILAYNGVREHADGIGEQIAHAAEQQGQVEEALAANSRPDLPDFAAFVDGLFQQSKDQLIRQLYMASRAYAFWALEDYALFYNLLGLNQPSTITAAVLRAAKTQILNAFANTVEDRGADPQLFPSPADLQKDPHTRGLVVTLDAKNFRRAFEELRDHKRTVFRLPAPRPLTTPRELQRPGESGATPFEGMAEVSVTTVRVFLNGATAGNNAFKVGIQHGGVHEFVRRDGQIVVLTSNPVRRTFSYEYIQQGDKKVLNIKQDGTITGKDENVARYAPLSPFTWWRIEVDPTYNPGLDLSRLTSVEMEFHGSSYPFSG